MFTFIKIEAIFATIKRGELSDLRKISEPRYGDFTISQR